MRLEDNPFFVLALPPIAARAEVERAGQRWLAELALNRAGAQSYATPLGPRARTPDAVRTALAELRDPAKRLVHELWAQVARAEDAPAPRAVFPWSAAVAAFGLKPRD